MVPFSIANMVPISLGRRMIEGGSVILLLLVEDGGAVNDAEEVL